MCDSLGSIPSTTNNFLKIFALEILVDAHSNPMKAVKIAELCLLLMVNSMSEVSP
jgi:hypothetical protein